MTIGMMEPLHHEQLPGQRIVRLLHVGCRAWHLAISKDCIPALLLLLNPLLDTNALGQPCHDAHVFGKTPQLLPQGKDPLARTFLHVGQELGKADAELLPQGGRDCGEFGGDFFHRMQQAVAKGDLGKERPHALPGAFKAIREDAPDPILWVYLQSGLVEESIGLSERLGRFRRGIPQVPEDTPLCDGRQVGFGLTAMGVCFIDSQVARQRELTTV
jgi:hypothetical protein